MLQITVEHKDRAHGASAEIKIAKLSLIDLELESKLSTVILNQAGQLSSQRKGHL